MNYFIKDKPERRSTAFKALSIALIVIVLLLLLPNWVKFTGLTSGEKTELRSDYKKVIAKQTQRIKTGNLKKEDLKEAKIIRRIYKSVAGLGLSPKKNFTLSRALTKRVSIDRLGENYTKAEKTKLTAAATIYRILFVLMLLAALLQIYAIVRDKEVLKDLLFPALVLAVFVYFVVLCISSREGLDITGSGYLVHLRPTVFGFLALVFAVPFGVYERLLMMSDKGQLVLDKMYAGADTAIDRASPLIDKGLSLVKKAGDLTGKIKGARGTGGAGKPEDRAGKEDGLNASWGVVPEEKIMQMQTAKAGVDAWENLWKEPPASSREKSPEPPRPEPGLQSEPAPEVKTAEPEFRKEVGDAAWGMPREESPEPPQAEPTPQGAAAETGSTAWGMPREESPERPQEKPAPQGAAAEVGSTAWTMPRENTPESSQPEPGSQSGTTPEAKTAEPESRKETVDTAWGMPREEPSETPRPEPGLQSGTTPEAKTAKPEFRNESDDIAWRIPIEEASEPPQEEPAPQGAAAEAGGTAWEMPREGLTESSQPEPGLQSGTTPEAKTAEPEFRNETGSMTWTMPRENTPESSQPEPGSQSGTTLGARTTEPEFRNENDDAAWGMPREESPEPPQEEPAPQGAAAETGSTAWTMPREESPEPPQPEPGLQPGTTPEARTAEPEFRKETVDTAWKMPREESSEQPTEKKVPLFCSNCGEKLSHGSKFCIYCGTKVEFPEETKSLDEPATHHAEAVSDPDVDPEPSEKPDADTAVQIGEDPGVADRPVAVVNLDADAGRIVEKSAAAGSPFEPFTPKQTSEPESSLKTAVSDPAPGSITEPAPPVSEPKPVSNTELESTPEQAAAEPAHEPEFTPEKAASEPASETELPQERLSESITPEPETSVMREPFRSAPASDSTNPPGQEASAMLASGSEAETKKTQEPAKKEPEFKSETPAPKKEIVRDLILTPEEAAAGCTKVVPITAHLSAKLPVPSGLRTGTRLKLKGIVPSDRDGAENGDLILNIIVR